MGAVYKLGKKEAEKINSVLKKLNPHSSRFTIDLKEMTVETKDDNLYDVSDLLDLSGKLSEKNVDELAWQIKESREEWDHE